MEAMSAPVPGWYRTRHFRNRKRAEGPESLSEVPRYDRLERGRESAAGRAAALAQHNEQARPARTQRETATERQTCQLEAPFRADDRSCPASGRCRNCRRKKWE